MYAMVNVAQYQIVATGATVSQCEQEYIQLLSESGVTETEDLPQTEASGTVAEIRSAVLEGNTYYFVRLEGGGGLLRPVRRGQHHRRDPQRGGSG